LGLIFQVQDDILDLVGDPEKLGKPVGSDQENDKSTYPGLLGLDGAINQKKHYIKSAEQALDASKANGTLLSELLYYFGQRDNKYKDKRKVMEVLSMDLYVHLCYNYIQYRMVQYPS